jgi:hypothetical protein
MRSTLFYSDQYIAIQARIMTFLNGRTDYLSATSLTSPRAVGDAIQSVLAEGFAQILDDLCAECSADFARRAMADIAFVDKEGFYYVVDVKTHRLDTKFNMPNLTSVERLSRLYETDANYFVVLLVNYAITANQVVVSGVHFVSIEFLQWNCLAVGALGWGQIQIRNSNVLNLQPQYSRKAWMLELCDVLMEFYPREIAKIDERVEHFGKIRASWQAKEDVWMAEPVEPPKSIGTHQS